MIERYEPAIQLSDVDPAVPDCDAAARPSAADRGDVVGERGLVAPEDAAGLHAEREHIVGAGDEVDHAVVDDRLRLARVLHGGPGSVEMRTPHALHVRDGVAIDLRERRIVLVEQVPAVLQPVAHRRRVMTHGLGDLGDLPPLACQCHDIHVLLLSHHLGAPSSRSSLVADRLEGQ